MHDLDPAHLPPAHRLALAYAPGATRSACGALLSLDARLGRIAGQSTEPIIIQMKLAWWRDQFGMPVEQWPQGEPLLAALAGVGLDPSALAMLVDGWEMASVTEQLDDGAFDSLAEGRAAVWRSLSDRFAAGTDTLAVDAAARRWSLADLSGRLPAGPLRETLCSSLDVESVALPRSLRPLAVLDALARLALRKNAPLLDGPAALAVAMRVGIFGR